MLLLKAVFAIINEKYASNLGLSSNVPHPCHTPLVACRNSFLYKGFWSGNRVQIPPSPFGDSLGIPYFIRVPGVFAFADFDTIFDDFDTISSNPTAFKAELMVSARSFSDPTAKP